MEVTSKTFARGVQGNRRCVKLTVLGPRAWCAGAGPLPTCRVWLWQRAVYHAPKKAGESTEQSTIRDRMMALSSGRWSAGGLPHKRFQVTPLSFHWKWNNKWSNQKCLHGRLEVRGIKPGFWQYVRVGFRLGLGLAAKKGWWIHRQNPGLIWRGGGREGGGWVGGYINQSCSVLP